MGASEKTPVPNGWRLPLPFENRRGVGCLETGRLLTSMREAPGFPLEGLSSVPSRGLAAFLAGLLFKELPVCEGRSEGIGLSFASTPFSKNTQLDPWWQSLAQTRTMFVLFSPCPLLCGYSRRTLEGDPLRRGWLRPVGSPGSTHFGCLLLRPCSL